ncbi:hypothetical protein C3747_123g87 [Trypanosoma cruzi]|uniref:Uncharacterized protein n=2 Tax=Trypanosoma cruzi TaxID=5693 RepID=Q4DCB1_TRYCC|nr:hypothetical protein, conserved [Trypanosoma cruzi]EAN90165.1 hypothetical protein, conserved [Trypanosoma cruzi]PWV05891.1 hypothetical protein C3747_123g87 [Trypanosoma cruzi]|eukprot:XP_812016.1 hypothetical protein [Trypanosoma cruzi strain CL Brener]
MNQFELFVASSESARSDAWRYLRRLRELDNRIDENMQRLREIAETVVKPTVTQRTEERKRKNGLPHGNEKRGRSPPGTVTSGAFFRGHGEDEDDVSSETSVVLLEPSEAKLRVEYRACRHRVLRYALEREAVAEELKACGSEMKKCLAVRMAKLRQTLRGVEYSSPGTSS